MKYLVQWMKTPIYYPHDHVAWWIVPIWQMVGINLTTYSRQHQLV